MGALKLVSTPTDLAASLDEAIPLEDAKAQLRVTHDDDDKMIRGLLLAAVQYAERFTGRAIIDQTWDYYFDAFPTADITLPKPPLISVSGLFYQDADGDEQTLASGFETDLSSEPARLSLSTGSAWPTAASVNNAVRVRFRAGYMDTSVSPALPVIPEIIKRAILIYLQCIYETQEKIFVGSSSEIVPASADQLLRLVRHDMSMA